MFKCCFPSREEEKKQEELNHKEKSKNSPVKITETIENLEKLQARLSEGSNVSFFCLNKNQKPRTSHSESENINKEVKKADVK